MSELPRPVSKVMREPVGEQAIHRMWRGISDRRAALRGHRHLMWRPSLLAAAAACAIALVWFVARGPTGGPLRLADGNEVGQVAFAGVTGEPRAVSLSDGSRLTLSPGTKLTHLENTALAFSLLLEAGRVDVAVTPGGPRQWSFECGLATVEVVGTQFSIHRRPERVRIEVTEGIVLVRGERVPDRVRRLTAGEELEISVPIATVEQPAPDAAAPPPADPREEDRTAPSPAASGKPASRAWRELARRGEYADAYRSLGDRGIAQESARSNVDDLLALADVARLSGHPAEAVAPLRRVIDEHPGDGRAAVAAFTLARIQLDSLGQPAGAAQSFTQAVALGLPAPLVEDARARIVEAYARGGNRDAARNAAEQYDKLYPAGRHAAAVRRWVND